MKGASARNDRWRWLTAGAVAVSLLAFLLLIVLLAWQGLRYFWPQPLVLFTLQTPNGQVQMLGEIAAEQQVSASSCSPAASHYRPVCRKA